MYGTIYAHPEHFGLRQVAMIDYSDGCYNFDYRVVWLHEDGTFYTGRDSGCSCPAPFEDYFKLIDLDVLNMTDLVNEVNSRDTYTTAVERMDFVRAVQKAMRDA